jgi:hypothetical protein
MIDTKTDKYRNGWLVDHKVCPFSKDFHEGCLTYA